MDILNTTLVILLVGFFSPKERDIAASNYIENHKELAVIEMYRTGIPASITMAQALHESNYGKSKLAVVANNHFGIKCKSYWKGITYFHKDDDFDDAGNLTDSCFRAYENVFDSYIDHSHFLTNTPHYQNLFQISSKDYEQWALGLQASGYATDPNYAKKLINIIHRYQLQQLDFEEDPFIHLKKIDNN